MKKFLPTFLIFFNCLLFTSCSSDQVYNSEVKGIIVNIRISPSIGIERLFDVKHNEMIIRYSLKAGNFFDENINVGDSVYKSVKDDVFYFYSKEDNYDFCCKYKMQNYIDYRKADTLVGGVNPPQSKVYR